MRSILIALAMLCGCGPHSGYLSPSEAALITGSMQANTAAQNDMKWYYLEKQKADAYSHQVYSPQPIVIPPNPYIPIIQQNYRRSIGW